MLKPTNHGLFNYLHDLQTPSLNFFTVQELMLKAFMVRPKSAFGQLILCALTDFSLSGVQSCRDNQEDMMTTKELYELNYTHIP